MSTLQEISGIETNQLAALLATVFTLFRQGRYENARDILKGLTILDESNPYIYGLLGAVYQKLAQDEQAIECYNSALKSFPNDIHSITNRGEIYLKLGKLDQAFSDLKHAIELDTNKKHPMANRARVLIALTQEALKAVKEKGMQEVVRAKIMFNQRASAMV